jgi:hypothetical protein
MDAPTAIGSLGVALLLLAFALNLAGLLPHERALYPALNLAGAAIAGYASWLIAFMPFVVLEATWALVAAAALARQLRRRASPPSGG